MKHAFSPWKLDLLLLLVALVVPQPGTSQATTGTILGTVTDTSGAVVPGVRVKVANIGTGLEREATTNEAGDYILSNLPLGNYRLTAEAKAFETVVREGLQLHVQEQARIDFAMRVGSTSEKISVTEAAPLVSTDDSSLKHLIDNQATTDLPLNGRNFVALAQMQPGVLPGIPGESLDTLLGNGLAIWANGQREFNNEWTLDGANMNIGFYSWNSFNPSPDAIQEFTLQTGMYSAEFGFQSGANVNIAIKSGTNQFHGTLYEYLQNSDMNARNFFAAAVPALHQNQFGGTIGGPVWLPKLYNGKDRTFFFVNYEGYRNRTQSLGLETVPTADQRTGDLSHTFNGSPFTGTILDPLSGTPFPGNIVPSSRITPQAQKILGYYPLPNTIGAATYNDYVLAPVPIDTDEAIVRVDQRIGNSDTLFAHYAQNVISKPSPQYIPGFYTSGKTGVTAHNAAVNYDHIFTPTTLNDFQVSFNRSFVSTTDPRDGTNFSIAQALDLPQITASGRTAGFPSVGILNYTTIGDNTGDPVIQPDEVWQFTDNLTLERGTHHFKTGIDFWHDRSDRWQGVNVRGSFSFTNNNPAGTGNSLGDFLLGLPNQTALGQAPGQEFLRNERYGLYFLDDWKVTPKLTLNLGLRYELATVLSDTRETVANFNFLTGQEIFYKAGQGIYSPYYGGWAPRFGFAYRPFGGDKTVIRGGYGIFYNIDLNGLFFSVDNNPPYATQASYFASAGNPITFGNPFPSAVAGAPTSTPNLGAVDLNYQPARVQTASLGVQRQLSKNTLLDLNALASRSFGLDRLIQPNSAPPSPLAVQPRRPYPNYGVINEVRTDARAWYYGLTAEIQHRVTNGLNIQSSYTFSRSLDQSFSGVAGQSNDSSYPQNSNALNLEKGLSATDRKNRWVSNFVYTVPFGPGQKYLTSGFAGAVAGGWQISGVYTAQSGEVLGANLAGDPINQGSPNNVARPNRVCNGNLSSGNRSIQEWFNTSCFVAPPLYTFGNAGRAFLIGPALFDVDLGVMRNFRIKERAAFQFRAEAFNSLNHTNFDTPGRYLGTTTFGVITSAEPARILQLGLKFIF
ncbi:MAG TPA: TonB-dependent receptor [Bryobacteraceae bacterium]|nr:TonB-dependent receptor [Bryobacteraceae bacterium]